MAQDISTRSTNTTYNFAGSTTPMGITPVTRSIRHKTIALQCTADASGSVPYLGYVIRTRTFETGSGVADNSVMSLTSSFAIQPGSTYIFEPGPQELVFAVCAPSASVTWSVMAQGR